MSYHSTILQTVLQVKEKKKEEEERKNKNEGKHCGLSATRVLPFWAAASVGWHGPTYRRDEHATMLFDSPIKREGRGGQREKGCEDAEGIDRLLEGGRHSKEWHGSVKSSTVVVGKEDDD